MRVFSSSDCLPEIGSVFDKHWNIFYVSHEYLHFVCLTYAGVGQNSWQRRISGNKETEEYPVNNNTVTPLTILFGPYWLRNPIAMKFTSDSDR